MTPRADRIAAGRRPRRRPARLDDAPGQGKRAITHVAVREALRGATLCEVTARDRQDAPDPHPPRRVRASARRRDRSTSATTCGPVIASPRLLLHAATLGFAHPVTGDAGRAVVAAARRFHGGRRPVKVIAHEHLAIRFAEPDDSATILAFIRELAEYERLLDEVTADEAALRATLFGVQRAADVLIAELEASRSASRCSSSRTRRSSRSPACISRICSCAPPRAARASARRLWPRSRASRSSATTAASNGACSIGTSPR